MGFNESDAQRLYEEKADWMGINSGGKILCTQQGCKYFTTFGTEALFEHCRVEHNWRDYPCPEENCMFVAYCSYTLKSGITLCFVTWKNTYYVFEIQNFLPRSKHIGPVLVCPKWVKIWIIGSNSVLNTLQFSKSHFALPIPTERFTHLDFMALGSQSTIHFVAQSPIVKLVSKGEASCENTKTFMITYRRNVSFVRTQQSTCKKW